MKKYTLNEKEKIMKRQTDKILTIAVVIGIIIIFIGLDHIIETEFILLEALIILQEDIIIKVFHITTVLVKNQYI